MQLNILYVNAINQTPMIVRSIQSILHFHPELEEKIIIIDNHSYDQASNITEFNRLFPRARIIPSAKNVGLARALNWGLYNATEPYLLFLNNDTYFEDAKSIPDMLAYMQAHKDIALLAPQMHNADGSLQRSCRKFYDISTILYRRTRLGKILGRKKLNEALMGDFDHQSIRDIDWVYGAAMFFNRKHIFDIGLFDERYPQYFEDMDISRRLWEGGLRVVYYPPAHLIHYHLQQSQTTRGWILNLLVALFVDFRKRIPFEEKNPWLDRYTNKLARLHIVSGIRYILKYMRSDIDIRNSTLQAAEVERYERLKQKHQNV